MLIGFSVKNFRSFQQEQTISLAAGTGSELKETNTFEIPPFPRLVHSCVLYGPNASGKSNWIRALNFLRQFVLSSSVAAQENQPIGVQPFKTGAKDSIKPSEFSIEFVCNNTRFHYRVAATEHQVIEEELFAFPKNRQQMWFTRHWVPGSKKYAWRYGAHFRGEHKAWEQMTRNNALYLSTAVQFNSEQLKPVYLWFKEQLVVLVKTNPSLEMAFNPQLTWELMKNPETMRWVQKFIHCADIGIEGFRVIEEKSTPPKYHIKTVHSSGASFDLLQDESEGTQRLFWQAGGWLSALRKGLVLCVDELHLHYHPHIVRYLIEMFHDPKLNPKNGQLVFTTHDTSLLDNELFRRDQVWFLQKDKHEASRLYSLLDFKPRKDEALGKGYLRGRYGALPFIGAFRFP